MESIASLLADRAEIAPDDVVFHAPGRPVLTYAGLLDHVEATASALAAAGVGPGSRVAIVLPNGPEMASAFLAVAACATSAPLNPAYRRQEHEFYLADLDAAALLVAEDSDSPAVEVARERGIPVLEAAIAPGDPAGTFRLLRDGDPVEPTGETAGSPGPDDIALILHTSGTTSRPKMVPLTQRNVLATARHIVDTLRLEPGDRCLNVMPLFHIHGLMAAVLSSAAAGASIVATPGFDASRFFPWLDEFAPTWYTAVPTMHQAILARAPRHEDILARRSLRFVRSSSASLPPQVMAELEKVFSAPVIEAYGMTEAAHQMACNPLPPRARKPGSVGPAAGPEVAVMSEESTDLLAAGETGEVVIRGLNVTPGYAANPEANQTAFVEGWFRTGDQGVIDGDGYLFLTGRLKEMINRAGENISPREIDEVLLDHPSVAQAVTFAMPDPHVGEEVAAAIVLEEGASLDDRQLWAFAETRLADFKVPRRFVFLDEIPKGPTGKLQRIGLADKLGLTAGISDEAAVRAEPETAEERALAEVAATLLEVDHVGLQDDLFGLGGDSLFVQRLARSASEVLGRTIPVYAVFRQPTLAGILAFSEDESAIAATEPFVTAPDRPVPATLAQEMLWVQERLLPGTTVNHRTGGIRLEGPLDEGRLRASIASLGLRHDALRARLPVDGARPVLLADADAPVLESAAPDDPDAEATFTREFLTRPFDLEAGPLARFALVRLGPEVHRLLVNVHHVVFDAWSMSNLARELVALYRGDELPEAPSFRAHAAGRPRGADAFEADLSWWTERLADLPTLPLPCRPGADRDSPDPTGEEIVVTVPAEVDERLRVRGRAAGLTPFMTYLALFQVLLGRWCGTEKVVLGAPVSGRETPEAEAAIGLFMNLIVLRSDLGGHTDLETVLTRVGTDVRDALARQSVPFPLLVRAIRPSVRLGRNPLFDVMFQLKPFPLLRAAVGPLRFIEETVFAGASRSDLFVDCLDGEAGLTFRFEYRTDLFDQDEIGELTRAWSDLVERAAGGS